MEAADCSKILVHIYRTVLFHIQEDSNLNVYWHQNVIPEDKVHNCHTTDRLVSNCCSHHVCTLPLLQVCTYSSLQC